MLLWVNTRIVTFLDLGGRGGKSSTMTTRHVTASQNWVQNKPKRINEMGDTELLTEKEIVELLRSKIRCLLQNGVKP